VITTYAIPVINMSGKSWGKRR